MEQSLDGTFAWVDALGLGPRGWLLIIQTFHAPTLTLESWAHWAGWYLKGASPRVGGTG